MSGFSLVLFFLFFSSLVSIIFLQFLKQQINAILISKVIKMYYESPALLNLTVCENALNLERTEEDEKPKKKSERMGEDKKGKTSQ